MSKEETQKARIKQFHEKLEQDTGNVGTEAEKKKSKTEFENAVKALTDEDLNDMTAKITEENLSELEAKIIRAEFIGRMKKEIATKNAGNKEKIDAALEKLRKNTLILETFLNVPKKKREEAAKKAAKKKVDDAIKKEEARKKANAPRGFFGGILNTLRNRTGFVGEIAANMIENVQDNSPTGSFTEGLKNLVKKTFYGVVIWRTSSLNNPIALRARTRATEKLSKMNFEIELKRAISTARSGGREINTAPDLKTYLYSDFFVRERQKEANRNKLDLEIHSAIVSLVGPAVRNAVSLVPTGPITLTRQGLLNPDAAKKAQEKINSAERTKQVKEFFVKEGVAVSSVLGGQSTVQATRSSLTEPWLIHVNSMGNVGAAMPDEIVKLKNAILGMGHARTIRQIPAGRPFEVNQTGRGVQLPLDETRYSDINDLVGRIASMNNVGRMRVTTMTAVPDAVWKKDGGIGTLEFKANRLQQVKTFPTTMITAADLSSDTVNFTYNDSAAPPAWQR